MRASGRLSQLLQVGNAHGNLNNVNLELDSHADTCALGRQCLQVLDHNRPVRVQGYDPTQPVHKYNTISGALAYNHPITGDTYYLLVHQAIHIPHLENHLTPKPQNPFKALKLS